MSQINASSFLFSRTAGFYDFSIDQSLRFNDGDSAYLSRTPASAGNRKTWTWSGWVKRSYIGATNGAGTGLFGAGVLGNNANFRALFDSDRIYLQETVQNVSNQLIWTSTPVFRDPSAWYNIVIAMDTTQASSADRVKVYVNNTEISGSFSVTPSQNQDTSINNNTPQYIGASPYNSAALHHYHGYLTDVNLIDGTALDPTSFGETKSGIWVPKDTSGLTFGTNGFRLAFADGAAIGDDTSGNTNDFTANNLAATDVVLDSPTNNFATHNNLASLGGMTFSEGNTKVRHADIGSYNHARSTMGMTSGKWYWEWYNSGSSGDAPNLLSGIVNDNVPVSTSNGYVGQNTNSYSWNGTGGERYYNGSNIGTIAIPTGDSSGIYMVAYDADSGSLYFGKNGTWANSGNPATGTGAFWTGIDTDTTWYPAGYTVNNDAGRWREVVVNHGQDSTFAGNKTAGGNTDSNGVGDFYYTPPSGFLALCSANLPTGAIDTAADETPEEYFNTVLWTGDATNPRTLTGVGFEPSFSWLKSRSQAFSHRLYDQIRGGGKVLFSDTTGAESGPDNGGDITAWTADGFTTSGALNNNNLNGSGYTYVGWNWKAGGTGVSNTDGSITSTVSVGATSQQNWFSVVGYTGNATAGATVGHGLNTQPDMIITKARGAVSNWFVYHSANTSQPETDYLTLETTNATTDNSTVWNDTAPTSSVFSIGQSGWNNTSGVDYIAYCFANAEGLCKAGSYTGNGSADGTFVYTGFRPAFLLVKSSTYSSTNWLLFDNRREIDNPVELELNANNSNQEYNNARDIDFISNGFKIRSGANNNLNTSGGNYIYLALAEQPFKYANAR